MSIGSFFKAIASKIKGLFVKIDRKKLVSLLETISDLIDPALKAAQVVAMLTPTTTDDLIIAALSRLKLTAASVLHNANEVYNDGARLALASEVLRGVLMKEIRSGANVKIGNIVLSSVEDALKLDKNLLRSAVQDAYTILKIAKP